jgi:hypothetical protein
VRLFIESQFYLLRTNSDIAMCACVVLIANFDTFCLSSVIGSL